MASWSVTAACLLVAFTVSPATQGARRLTHDVTLKYFSDVSMMCDHHHLNVTQHPGVKSISWLFPDGSVRSVNEDLANMTKFSFAPPHPDVPVAVDDRSVFSAYTLNVTKIDDEVFGHYSCVVVFQSTSDDVAVIRWGLNVNGADFSELTEMYKKNAVIGGIAAATMLVVVGGGCLLWNFSYAKRLERRDDAEAEMDEVAVIKKQAAKDNDAFSADANVEVTAIHQDNGDGTAKM